MWTFARDYSQTRGMRAALCVMAILLPIVLALYVSRSPVKRSIASYWYVQLEEAPDERVPSIIASLQAMEEEGIAELVRAMGSPRETVARAAEQAIDEDLARWRASGSIVYSERAAILCEALAEHAESFGPTARLHASDLARRILKTPLDNEAADSGQVIADCGRVLDIASQQRMRLAHRQPIQAMEAFAAIGGEMPRDLPLRAVEPLQIAAEVETPSPAIGENHSDIAQASPEPDDVLPDELQADDNVQTMAVRDLPPTYSESGSLTPFPNMSEVAQHSYDYPSTSAVAKPSSVTGRSADELTLLTDIEVMRQLHDPNAFATEAAEEELRRRGFRGVHISLARGMTSEDPLVRERTARAVLVATEVNPTPWLDVLCADEDPRVRHAAIGAMMASDNEELQRQARERAIRDADAAVQRMATAPSTRVLR